MAVAASAPHNALKETGAGNGQVIHRIFGSLTTEHVRNVACVFLQGKTEGFGHCGPSFGAVVASNTFAKEFDVTLAYLGIFSSIVFVQVGAEFDPTSLQVLSACSKQYPGRAVAVLALPEHGEYQTSARQAAAQQRELRFKLLQNGANNVITLCGNEALTATRLGESITMARMQASTPQRRKGHKEEAFDEAISDTDAHQRVQERMRTRMWSWLGEHWENIPRQDDSIKEVVSMDELREIEAIGNYKIMGGVSRTDLLHAEHPVHGKVTMKALSKYYLRNVSRLAALHRDIKSLRSVPSHRNINAVHAIFNTASNVYMVMNYVGSMDLWTFMANQEIKTGAPLPIETVRSFSKQQALAVAHLHSVLVCHRDIRPFRFIVSENETELKLSDSAAAIRLQSLGERVRVPCGVMPFVAPEVYAGGRAAYDPMETDCWSLGVNMAEMTLGVSGVERLLGWDAHRPNDIGARLYELPMLEPLWAQVPEDLHRGMRNDVLCFLRVNPMLRWSALRFCSAEVLRAELLLPRSGRARNSVGVETNSSRTQGRKGARRSRRSRKNAV